MGKSFGQEDESGQAVGRVLSWVAGRAVNGHH